MREEIALVAFGFSVFTCQCDDDEDGATRPEIYVYVCRCAFAFPPTAFAKNAPLSALALLFRFGASVVCCLCITKHTLFACA